MTIAVESSDGSIATCEERPSKRSTMRNFGVARIAPLLVWFLFPATLCLAITGQSLWMDEGYTVWFASRKSIGCFYSALIGSPGAPGDPQMFLYLLYMWGWVKCFGKSEIALRAANIPFAILFIGTMSWASRRFLRQANLWVLFCLAPFFWFYLNEARPYIALIAFSGVAVVSLLAYLTRPDEYRVFAPWTCLIALLLAWGTHILGAFLFPSMVVLTAATLWGDLSIRSSFMRDWYRPALFCSPAFIVLATFYIWTSRYGVNISRNRLPGLLNLPYVLYEFIGFGGLGPRHGDQGINRQFHTFIPYWPWLLLGVVALLMLKSPQSVAAVRTTIRNRNAPKICVPQARVRLAGPWSKYPILIGARQVRQQRDNGHA